VPEQRPLLADQSLCDPVPRTISHRNPYGKTERVAMKAGRELNALVSEKVMGYRRTKDDCNTYWVDSDGLEPTHSIDFSSNISAAWEVVEKMGNMQTPPYAFMLAKVGSIYSVHFREEKVFDSKRFYHEGINLPECICLAALKACGVEV
jgi:hypothetical protein